MIDLRRTIAPKSDQLNADDLIGASRIIRVTSVELCQEAEQPVAIRFEGDNGKPWRPCKSMRRVLVSVWGPDAKAYAGRKIKLYRDDKVLFGGVAVGGIRISHVSGIDKAVTMALTMARTSRKPYTVQPLQDEPENPGAADIETTVAAAQAAALNGIEALKTFWDGLDKPSRLALQPSMQKLKNIAAKNDFASDTDARAPHAGGQRASAPPESLAGAPGRPLPTRGAQASGAAGRLPPGPLQSPDATPFEDDVDADPPDDPLEAAYLRGKADRRAGKSIRSLPQEYRNPEYKAEAGEWRSGWTDEDKERTKQ